MASITFENAQRWYPGADIPAVPGLDLTIEDGEFMVLVGPSGCGKSTSLRMLAGLEDINGGRILIGDRDITHVAPKDRDIAMVFQSYALYPHKTVESNMAFPLAMAGMPVAERTAKVRATAALLGLTDFLQRKPRALSGGQRQRVAMGRALVREPQVFLLDEPLSNLDAKMRVQTRTDIARLQRELGITTVYVTHDQVEAMTMGDRVAVMKDGQLQQVDTPLNLYDKPANLFVASFIGSPQMALLPTYAEAGVAVIGGYRLRLPSEVSGAVTVGVRPEAWRVVGEDEPGLDVTVSVVEELGADGYVYCTTELDGTQRQVIVRASTRQDLRSGDPLRVAIDPVRIHLFDTTSGERVPS
jgi:multiple sugar transport system ATP-binding protein